MSWKTVFQFVILVSVFNLNCEGLPLPETEIPIKEEITSLPNVKESFETEVRAGQEKPSGGISSAMSGFQNGISTLLNASNMKESKLIMGGFSIFIIPGPDLQQLGQLNPGMISQLPSLIPSQLPGKK